MIKKIILINIFITFHILTYPQKGNISLLSEYEDTMKIIAQQIIFGETEIDRENANNAFILHLNEVLNYEKSFKFPFDSLTTISKIKSPDNLFRIFNWILRKDNGTIEYFGYVHYNNRKKKRYEIIPLIDNSKNIRLPEDIVLDANNWFGCLYYDIIFIKKGGRKFYTLLGWDGNDGYSTKKIIDVMYFSGKNKIKFGLPIFKKDKKESKKRVVLEYDSKTSVSLKYHKEDKKIVFNHLIARNKDLEGLHEFYIPEGTFNSYNYNQGKWWFKENIDIRNIKKPLKTKKPKRGLLPQ